MCIMETVGQRCLMSSEDYLYPLVCSKRSITGEKYSSLHSLCFCVSKKSPLIIVRREEELSRCAWNSGICL